MGDGIHAFITIQLLGCFMASNCIMPVGNWMSKLDVKRGDVMDFIVDIGNGINNDQYLWTVVIEEIRTTAMAQFGPTFQHLNQTSWMAGSNWHGPDVLERVSVHRLEISQTLNQCVDGASAIQLRNKCKTCQKNQTFLWRTGEIC